MKLTGLFIALLALPALTLALPSPQGPSKEDIRNGKPGIKARFDGQQVVRLTAGKTISKSVWDQVEKLHLDVWKHTKTELHVRVDADERKKLAAIQGVQLTTIVEDVQKIIDAEQRTLSAKAQEKYGSPTWFNNYHNLDELTTWYYDLAKAHSDIVTSPVVLGNTIENRPLIQFTVTGPGDASKRPRIWLQGLQHAREWIAAATVQYFVDTLVNNYVSGDSRVTALLSKVVFVVVPVVNPDGYAYTWSSNRLWRKNREYTKGGQTYGVDINRNWADHWGPGGSSSDPSADDFRGPSAASTREVQILSAAYVKTPNVVAGVDFHSYSELVLRPNGWTNTPSVDEARFSQVGQQFADDIAAQSGESYTSERSIELYETTGDVTSWWYGAALAAKKKAGIVAPRPYSFAVELRPSDGGFGGQGFVLSPDQIIPTGQEIYAALLHFSEDTSSNPLPNA